MTGALRRARGEAPDEALGPTASFGLGATAGAVSAVSTKSMMVFVVLRRKLFSTLSSVAILGVGMGISVYSFTVLYRAAHQ